MTMQELTDNTKIRFCIKLYNKHNRRAKPRYVLWSCYVRVEGEFPKTPQGYGKAPSLDKAGEAISAFLKAGGVAVQSADECFGSDKECWKAISRMVIQRDYFEHGITAPGFMATPKGEYIPITETRDYINARKRAYRKRKADNGHVRLDITLPPKLVKKLQPHLDTVGKRRGITGLPYGFILVEWLNSLELPELKGG